MMLLMFKTLPARVRPLPEFTRTVTKVIFQGTDGLQIRQQAFEDLQQTRATWILAEGWPGVKHSLAATYSLDPEGFYMLEKDNEKVASISVVSYPEIKFAYIGFYVVPKQLRGQGYGGFIFNKSIDYTMRYRGITTIGLNCLASMTPLYSKWGFVKHTVDDIWKLTASETQPAIKDDACEEVKEMTPALLSALVDYDAAIFGTQRRAFLDQYIQKANTTTVVCCDKDEIKGYGIISERSPAQEEPHLSYRIGPLYAQNNIIAQSLLNRLIAATDLKPKESIFLETPGTNAAAAPLVTQFGFERVACMDKMYNGEPPNHDDQKIFAYCSLATGG